MHQDMLDRDMLNTSSTCVMFVGRQAGREYVFFFFLHIHDANLDTQKHSSAKYSRSHKSATYNLQHTTILNFAAFSKIIIIRHDIS